MLKEKKFNHSNVQLFVTLALVALEWCLKKKALYAAASEAKTK
jgi:hypothetical protein